MIPAARLRDEDLPNELRARLSGVPDERLSWRFGAALGEGVTLDRLVGEFDGVFVGLGLPETVSLLAEGETVAGVEPALSFLRRMKSDPSAIAPSGVAVIGGGNTAMDAASTAAARGAKDVYLIYRRSFAEMPAWPGELDEVLAAGVHLLVLTEPAGYESKDGRLRGVRTVRTVLRDPDESGRRRPEPISGSDAVIAVDLAVEAIGQRPPAGLADLLPGVDLTPAGLVSVEPTTMATTREGVFAGGDIVSGGTTAVRAIAEGVRAARSLLT